ncbi:MAG: hypothetical protein ACLP7A_00220 [Desulfobaccales bacterium]
MVGSFGLITVAPFTAAVGGLVYVKWRGAHDPPQPQPLPLSRPE